MLAAWLLLAASPVMLDVPYVPQPKDGCAAAALAMVMKHWGHTIDVDAAVRELKEPELRGIRGSRLEEYARGQGFTALAYKGDLAQLGDYLAKGRPLVVAWGLPKGDHDVVVVGLDEQDVVVHDPDLGASRRVARREFEKRWQRAGYWTLLVLPQASPRP
jgi:ABC-type bacteriocin/lantibiotic exporter with double-glycine peptidase domain